MPDSEYIVSRSARFMGLEMSDDGALEVAVELAVRCALPTVCCVECVISPSEARWHHLGRYRCSGVGYVEC
ncbi:hypothetical protein ACVXG9_08250 [Escherichia coli]